VLQRWVATERTVLQRCVATERTVLQRCVGTERKDGVAEMGRNRDGLQYALNLLSEFLGINGECSPQTRRGNATVLAVCVGFREAPRERAREIERASACVYERERERRERERERGEMCPHPTPRTHLLLLLHGLCAKGREAEVYTNEIPLFMCLPLARTSRARQHKAIHNSSVFSTLAARKLNFSSTMRS